MVIGMNMLVQVDNDVFKACKQGVMKSITIPPLGTSIFRGDYLTLQSRMTGELADFEVVHRPVVLFAKDGKNIESFTCDIKPVKIHRFDEENNTAGAA